MAAAKVQTVLGDVEPSALGITLTHEHLVVSLLFRGQGGGAQEQPQAPRDPRASQPIKLENVGWIRRNWLSHPDNMRLDEEDVAIDELRLFKEAGGRTIVDATNPDLKRDPEALARLRCRSAWSQGGGRTNIASGSVHGGRSRCTTRWPAPPPPASRTRRCSTRRQQTRAWRIN